MADDTDQQDSPDIGNSGGLSFDQIKYLIEKTQAVPAPKVAAPPKASPFQPAQQPPSPVPANQPQAGKTLDQASGAYIRPDTAASLQKFRQIGDQYNPNSLTAAGPIKQPQQQVPQGATMDAQTAYDQLTKQNPSATTQQKWATITAMAKVGAFKPKADAGAKGGAMQYYVDQLKQSVNPETGKNYTALEALDAYKSEKRAGATELGAGETAKQAAKVSAAADMKTNEVLGKERGDAVVNYDKLQAGMPALKRVVNDLGTLAELATYTEGGKLYNTALRQLGQPMTEGGNARAEYDARINNVLLPTLRSMFGARVTNFDVTTAKSILGDPNLAPSEKKRQLNAFIDQKMEQVKSDRDLVNRLGGKTGEPSAPTAKTINFSDLPD